MMLAARQPEGLFRHKGGRQGLLGHISLPDCGGPRLAS